MMNTARKPARAKPKVNRARQIMDREQKVREKSAAAAAASESASAPRDSERGGCKNPECQGSNIIDGTCRGCGREYRTMDIRNDVTFGESSSGAAVVQGSHLGADQGGFRGAAGNAFRRTAGGGQNESRERSLREVKQIISQFARQLRLSDSLADTAFRSYKHAVTTANFNKGRRINIFAAVCLYAACRREPECKVMLIDFADLLRVDMFLLGHVYNDFLKKFPSLKEGSNLSRPEDLIWRFAVKLEFDREAREVVRFAQRIVQRMRRDHILEGRKPAGICGAAVIMAARALGFRRTVTEVVFIAKVTEHTLEARMQEFAEVPSAQMSVDTFQETDGVEEEYDPPVLWKRSKEWLKKHPTRPKRKLPDIEKPVHQAQQNTAKRHYAGPQESAKRGNTSTTTYSDMPAQPFRVDADGFAIPHPPGPPGKPDDNTEKAAYDRALGTEGNEQLGSLADAYGYDDSELAEESQEFSPSSEMAIAIAQGIEVPRRRKAFHKTQGEKSAEKYQLPIDDAWKASEAALMQEMGEILDDEAITAAANSSIEAEKQNRRREEMVSAQQQNENDSNAGIQIVDETLKPLDRPIVGEDEFENDPEVMHCKLSEEETRIKERIWANANQDYMRALQQKIHNRKMDARNPKPVRHKRKKSRAAGGSNTHEGASSELGSGPVLSRRINYSRGDLFVSGVRGPGSTFGGTNSAGSAAPSRTASVDPEADGDAKEGTDSTSDIADASQVGDDEEIDDQYEGRGEAYAEGVYNDGYDDAGDLDPFGNDF